MHRALRALVPHTRFLRSCAPLSLVSSPLRALVPHVPRAFRVLVPQVLVSYVLSCLRYLVTYVLLGLTSFNCIMPNILSWISCLVAFVFRASYVFHVLDVLDFFSLDYG